MPASDSRASVVRTVHCKQADCWDLFWHPRCFLSWNVYTWTWDPSYLKLSWYFNSSSSFHQHIPNQLKGGLQTKYFISLFQRNGPWCREKFCVLAKVSVEQWTGRGIRPNSPWTRSCCPFGTLDVIVRLPVPLTVCRGNEIRVKLWWEGCEGRGALEQADRHNL